MFGKTERRISGKTERLKWMKQTGIEYVDSSWNPIRGCKAKSEGCANCWAERIAGRFSIKQQKGSKDEEEDGRFGPRPGIMSSIAKIDAQGQPRWTGRVQWVGDKFFDPLVWKDKGESRRILVCSMSDLFYPKVGHEWRDAIFGLISLCAEHTFLVQTKYAAEMRQYFAERGVWKRIEKSARSSYKEYWGATCPSKGHLQGPLANTWFGVSVENQAAADERIPILQDMSAVFRYVDVQPLLGEITLEPFMQGEELDWVIVGGESGMNGRPCDPAWVRRIKQECKDYHIPMFMHQWGAWLPVTSEQLKEHAPVDLDAVLTHGADETGTLYVFPSGEMAVNLTRSDSKSMKASMEKFGALLDGEDWKQIPEVELEEK